MLDAGFAISMQATEREMMTESLDYISGYSEIHHHLAAHSRGLTATIDCNVCIVDTKWSYSAMGTHIYICIICVYFAAHIPGELAACFVL